MSAALKKKTNIKILIKTLKKKNTISPQSVLQVIGLRDGLALIPCTNLIQTSLE